jgi:L-threonylcarbamoyladenylate synthase
VEVLRISGERPEAAVLERAAAVLRRGGLVAFPTETVYGLGADARQAAAVARIFAVKGRPANNPLIVHVATPAAARALVTDWPPVAQRLAERFWPGPLTLVLPRRPEVPAVVTGGGPTVAVRLPAHPVALALLQTADVPIAAPSANRSGQLSPTRAAHVLRSLGDQVDLVLDGGPTPGGVESTVLDLTVTPPRLLRPGLVSPTALEAVIGPIQRPENLFSAPQAPLPSPGLLPRHYAPCTPLECWEDAWPRVQELLAAGQRVGWLTFAQRPVVAEPGLRQRRLPADPAHYAAQLYAVLHELDEAGLDRLLADLPPANDDWLAIRDRLCRAATPGTSRPPG